LLRAGLNSELEEEYLDFVRGLELPGSLRGPLGRLYDDGAAARRAMRRVSRTTAVRWALEGVLHYLESWHARAVSCLEQALALGISQAWTHFWLALSRYAVARLRRRPEGYPQALAAADAAVALDAANPWFHLHRASLYADFGRPEEALADLGCALQAAMDSVRVRFERGRMLAELERYEEAMQDVRVLLRLFPERGFAHALHALAAIEARRVSEALQAIDRAVVVESNSGVNHAWRGEIRRKAGLYRQALADFDRSLELGSRDPLHFAWRGKTRLTVGDLHGAYADLTAAARTYPEYQSSYAWRAEANFKLGNSRQAVLDLERVYPLNLETSWSCEAGIDHPRRALLRRARFLSELRGCARKGPWTKTFRGMALYSSGAEAVRTEACRELRSALSESRRLAPAAAFLGLILARSGRGAEGLGLIEQALEMCPTKALYRGFRAEALAGLGRKREAAEEARIALMLDGMLRSVWTLAGRLHLELGAVEESRRLLEVAACLEPRRWEVYFWRAQARKAAGDLAGCRRDLDLARALHGGSGQGPALTGAAGGRA